VILLFSGFMARNTTLENLEPFFLALADKTRLRILNLMGEDEICVGNLVEVLGESQPKISRHLAYLKSAGLVSVRRDGKWMHYRIEQPDDPAGQEILGSLLSRLGEQDQMRKERRKLEEIGGVTGRAITPKKKLVAPRREKKEILKTATAYFEVDPDIEYEEENIPEEIQEERAAQPPPFQREELETFLL
jgi:ArsR family transcriptional regulator